MENWRIEYMAARCRIALEAYGFDIKIVQDFDAVPELMSELGGRCSPVLDPKRNLFTKGNALWMFAFKDGAPVIGGGVRVDDLGDENLSSFIERSLRLTFGVTPEPEPYEMFDMITGRVAYFGDLRASTAGGLGKIGQKAISLFTAYGHHLIMRDLKADFTYCYLRAADLRRSIHYNFRGHRDWPWRLDRDMYPDGSPKWVAYLDKKDVPGMLLGVNQDLGKLLSEDDKSLLSGKG